MTTQSAARSVSSALASHRADDPDGKARTRERLTEHHVVGQPQRQPDVANLVLEQVAQRLDQLEAEVFGKSADVVVGLDLVGVVGVMRGQLDHIGIERSLREEIDVPEPGCLLFEDTDERRPDAPPFLLGVDDPAERVEKLGRRIDMNEVDVSLGSGSTSTTRSPSPRRSRPLSTKTQVS